MPDPISQAAIAWAVNTMIFGSVGNALVFGSIVHATVVVASSMALGFVAQALTPSPPKPREAGFTSVVRSSDEPVRLIYGRRVVSGPLELATTTGKLNKYLHLVIPLMGFQSRALRRVWFNDEVLGDLDSGGKVTSGRFDGTAWVYKHLGREDQAADANLVAEVPEWTSAHRLRGHSYIGVKMKYGADVYATGWPNIKVELDGKLIEDPRDSAITIASSSQAAQTTIATSAAHGLVAGDRCAITGHTGATPGIDAEHLVLTAPTATTLTIDVNVTVAGTGGSLRKLWWTDNSALCLRDYVLGRIGADGDDAEMIYGLGALAVDEIDDTLATAAANVCDEEVDLPAALPTFTFTASAGDDVLTQKPPSGKEFGKPASEDGVKPEPLHTGDGVEVSTTGTLPAGLAAATRYFAIVDTDTEFKVATTLTNARRDAAIDITSGGSGTHTCTRKSQPRYTTNAVIPLDRRPIDIAPDLVTAMLGALVYPQGAYAMFAGAYTGPATVTLTESNMRQGSLAIRRAPSKAHKYNAVRGTFTDRDQDHQPVAFPPITNAAYAAEDKGRIFKDLDLRHVTDSLRAQRLATLMLRRDRNGLTCDFPANHSALPLSVMETVDLTLDRPGWAGKEFEVLGFKESAGGAYDLALKETAAAIWAWDPDADATLVDLTPNTNLPSAFDVEPPTDLVLASGDDELLPGLEGSVISRIKASWAEADDAFVTHYEVQFKKSAESEWSTAPTPIAGQTQVHISDVEDGVAYDVRVRSVNQIGASSAWATSLGHILIGKTAPPPDVATFQIDRRTGVRKFTFGLTVTPADVRSGGGFRIRSSTDLTADWEDMDPLHDGLLLASPWEINEPAAGTWLFAIKAVDSSGNKSTNAKFILETLGASQLLNVLASRVEQDESPAWPGTLVDCFKTPGNTLLAVSDGDIDDLPPTINALPATIATILPSKSPISYTTPTIDLGFDVTFTPVVAADVNGALTLAMKTGTEADGAPVGSFVALASVIARYIQIKASVAGTNPEIFTMITALDAEVAIDRFEDVATGSETSAWFNSIAAGHFEVGGKSGDLVSIGHASLVLQSVGSGWTWELISKSKTVNGQPAAEFKIYNGSGTLADATVDVTLIGPKVAPASAPSVRITTTGATRVTTASDIRIAA